MTIQQAFGAALQHHQAGRLAEAEALYRQILAAEPRHADALHLLGVIAHQVGRNALAVELIRQAIAVAPGAPETYSNLGEAYRALGQLDNAVVAYRQAIALQPNLPEAYHNLGVALYDQGQVEEAITAYRRAIGLNANYLDAHNNLGNALRDQGQLDEAITSYRQAIALDLSHAESYNNLGNVLKDQGQLDEAIAAYRKAIALQPDFSEAHSNLVFTLHYRPGLEARALAEELDRWSQQHAVALRQFIEPHVNDPTPHRRLRIGYVSPDLQDHVVGRYLRPLFEHHDRTQFEVFCYSGVRRPDQVTERFRDLSDHWRSTVDLEDHQVAAQIREDRVDILVDLSLHTAHNRLLVFARQPAPVQVSYGGYPGSTGLKSIEYRISDRWLEGKNRIQDPRSRNQDGCSAPHQPASCDLHPASCSVFLLDSFWCYEPLGAEPSVRALPAMENGVITFGCLNNFCKVNEPVLALWAQILRRVDGSTLLLQSFAGGHRERTLAQFQQLGVEASRVEFVAPKPRREYLELYQRMDIALETFPYNGHTTSLDAFWMGVPVPGLAGECPVSRAGLSHLMNLGLPELAATSEDEYVDLVVKLAGDLPRLEKLRATLRSRMEASGPMDAPRYARQIEAAYRSMWREWCAQQESPSPEGRLIP